MKLTKTQKKFRREMAKAGKEFEKIYDNPYDQPYVRRKTSSRGSWTGILVFIAVIVFVILLGSNNDSSEGPRDIRELGEIAAVSSRGSAAPGNETNVRVPANIIYNEADSGFRGKVLSRSEADDLRQMDWITAQVTTHMEAINQYLQSTPMHLLKEQEDYRQALIAGIDACQAAKEDLAAMNCSEEFAGLKLLKQEQIEYTQQSWSCLLEYCTTGENALITQSNRFNEMIREKSRQYIFELEEYLKNNGYRYSVEGNSIKYWYSSR